MLLLPGCSGAGRRYSVTRFWWHVPIDPAAPGRRPCLHGPDGSDSSGWDIYYQCWVIHLKQITDVMNSVLFNSEDNHR